MPNFKLETAAGGRVAGVDEVGRGPLAGPVLAAAVVFTKRVPTRLARMIDDSKKLTAEQRALAFQALLACPVAQIAVGAASVEEIARLNILHAALLAMRRAVGRLPALPCPTQCVVEGDTISLSIAAASIVAKVIRDRAMARLAVRFPGYGWEANAGYPTVAHRAALRRLGPTPHHRRDFGTVRLMAAEAKSDLFRRSESPVRSKGFAVAS
jgi:ribonuclease HII